MPKCTGCGCKIDSGDYCQRCQSKTLFDDPATALPDCFDWEIPQPEQAEKPARPEGRSEPK